MAGDVCAIFVSICGFFFVLMKSAQVEDTNGCTFHHSIGFAGASIVFRQLPGLFSECFICLCAVCKINGLQKKLKLPLQTQ